MQQAFDAIPEGLDCSVTIDCDGLGLALTPAIGMLTPGGIDYLELLYGVASKGRIAGYFVVQFIPEKDPHGVAALMAVREMLTGLGLIRGLV